MSSSLSSDHILDLGDGLVIRRMRAADAQSSARHANDPDIARQMRDRFPSPYSEQDANYFIDFTNDPANCRRTCSRIIDPADPTKVADNEKLVPANYAIALDGEAIGAIGVMFRNDIERRTAEIGYWCM